MWVSHSCGYLLGPLFSCVYSVFISSETLMSFVHGCPKIVYSFPYFFVSRSSSSSCQVSLATLVVSAIPSCHFFLFSAALRSESRSAPVRIWWAEVTQGGRVHSCGESPRGSHERRGGRTGLRRRSFEGRAAKYQLLREKLFACAWDVWRWLAAQYCLGLGIYLVSQ